MQQPAAELAAQASSRRPMAFPRRCRELTERWMLIISAEPPNMYSRCARDDQHLLAGRALRVLTLRRGAGTAHPRAG
jgi:hypothetical protein